MDPKKVSALAALALVIGAGIGYAMPAQEARPEPSTGQLLAASTDDCRAMVIAHDAAPECRRDTVDKGKSNERRGWLCNGAYMGAGVQECLTVAADKLLE